MNNAENSEIKVLKFDIGYLFACMPFTTKTHALPALEGIILGDGWMGASFGAAMIIVEDDVFKGSSYLLSVDDVWCLYEEVVDRQKNDAFFVDDFELRIISATEASAVVNGGEFMHSIILLNHDVPDLKKVDIKAPEVIGLSVSEMPYFNPKFLSFFLDAASLYSGDPVMFLKLLPTGAESPIYVEMTGNMHGLLVPARLGDALSKLSLYKGDEGRA